MMFPKKKYSIKVLMKEGGGGDNMALAWSFGDEAAPADGADPILQSFYWSILQ